MNREPSQPCPECAQPGELNLGRRDFLRLAGAGLATGVLSGSVVRADSPASTKPAEALIRELAESLSPEQKKDLILPWNHGAEKPGQKPTRLQTFNRPALGKRIADSYTKPQQELVKRILKATLSGEEAFERMSRHGKWDSSGSFEGNGALIFGDPNDKFSWVFAGHHLTVRCDGNSEPGAAFGGPMYYGHSAHGYSSTNVYHYQTKQVTEVFDALTDNQRQQAVLIGDPGDHAERSKKPEGVAYADLDETQQKLVAQVMRVLLDPFRKEDGDEVMSLIKSNGGMEKIRLAFYKDEEAGEPQRWDYWRLEGPGFVWNYRVLPHVHCHVNIVAQS